MSSSISKTKYLILNQQVSMQIPMSHHIFTANSKLIILEINKQQELNSVIFQIKYMEKQITSVFSDYDSIDNNSLNSKQLQYWLKQTTSPEISKTGFEWTFMSNASSRYEPEELSFGHRHPPISSITQEDYFSSKENNSVMSNLRSQVSIKKQKNKSYVNAMIALQKQIKVLEQKNHKLIDQMRKINEERKQSVSESFVKEQQLKKKINYLEPKQAKISELIEEKKKIREEKEEKVRKLKVYEKNLHQSKTKYEELLLIYQQTKSQRDTLQATLNSAKQQQQQAQKQARRLIQKNKQLQSAKQSSTAVLLQKYNESIELTERYERQNTTLKKQIDTLKKTAKNEESRLSSEYNRQISSYKQQLSRLEGMKSNIEMSNSIAEEKRKESEYFKQLYEKKDEEFYNYVNNQNQVYAQYRKQIEQLKQELTVHKSKAMKAQTQLRIAQQARNTQLKCHHHYENTERPGKSPETRSFDRPTSKNKKVKKINNEANSEIINLPETVAFANKRQYEQSFNGFQSEIDDAPPTKNNLEPEVCQEELNESYIPYVQTKSLGKPSQNKSIKVYKNLAHSSSNKRKKSLQNSCERILPNVYVPKSRGTKKNHSLSKGKQKGNNNHKTNNFETKFGNKSKSNDGVRQPKTQPQHKITFQGGDSMIVDQPFVNSYIYGPQQWQPFKEINGFEEENRTKSSPHNINSYLLVQLQKELLELYEEQEKLLMASNQEYMSQNDRSQFFGRLKQINEQLRVKNQKVCQLKAQL